MPFSNIMRNPLTLTSEVSFSKAEREDMSHDEQTRTGRGATETERDVRSAGILGEPGWRGAVRLRW
jgi:hypothetical protein